VFIGGTTDGNSVGGLLEFVVANALLAVILIVRRNNKAAQHPLEVMARAVLWKTA